MKGVILGIFFCATIVTFVRCQLITFNTTWSFTTSTTRDHSIHPFYGVTRYEEMDDPRLYEKAIKSEAYVDKSSIIKDLVADEHKNIMICVPRHFGSTTILDMVRKFFDVIYHVERKKFANKTRTRNYRVFNNGYFKIKISEDKTFFDEHFATHPVIMLNFGPMIGINAKAVIVAIQLVLAQAFMDFDFIPNLMKRTYTKKLAPGDKAQLNLFLKLADEGFDEQDVDETVEILLKFIYKFYDKKSIVIIDHVDAPLTFAINKGITKGTSDVIGYMDSVLEAFTSHPEYVEKTIIVGTSRMYLANASSRAHNIHFYDFLQPHKYNKYFGLTEIEVEELFKKYFMDERRKQQVKNYYLGYQVKNSNLSLYCPLDIYRYLTEGYFQTGNYWIREGEYYNSWIDRHRIWYKLSRYMKYDSVLRNATQLMTTKKIQFQRVINVGVEDIQIFAEMINGTRKKKSFSTKPFPVNMYLTYLYEHGFLSLTNEENTYKMPNREIEDEFRKEFKIFFSDGTSAINDTKLLQDVQNILK